jgi:CheY-like chemotaxis protein
LDKYRIAVIDDNGTKLDVLRNDFELYAPSFDTVGIIVNDASWTKEKIIQKLKDNEIDAVVIDYLLKSTSNGVSFNGDKVVNELILEFRNLPVIMISEVKQQAVESDINEFHFIDRREFSQSREGYLLQIKKLIDNAKKIEKESEDEIIRLLNKNILTDDEKLKLVKLDNFLEESLLYESRLPNYYKDIKIGETLTEHINALDKILMRLDDE